MKKENNKIAITIKKTFTNVGDSISKFFSQVTLKKKNIDNKKPKKEKKVRERKPINKNKKIAVGIAVPSAVVTVLGLAVGHYTYKFYCSGLENVNEVPGSNPEAHIIDNDIINNIEEDLSQNYYSDSYYENEDPEVEQTEEEKEKIKNDFHRNVDTNSDEIITFEDYTKKETENEMTK